MNVPRVKLKGRELQIYNGLLAGATIKQLAFVYGIALSTAVTYQRRVFRKLEVNNIAEMIIQHENMIKRERQISDPSTIFYCNEEGEN